MPGDYSRNSYTWVSYEDSKRASDFLQSSKFNFPAGSPERRAADRLIRELSFVKKDVDYSPFLGYQLVLSSKDRSFLDDVLSASENKEG